MKRRCSTGAVVGRVARTAAIAGIAYVVAIRPWHTNWGAVADEMAMPLPGDDLIPNADYTCNHAVTIEAPIADVWPWLVQIGYHRAGWYSYDALHKLMNVAGSVDDPERSATRIVPELQNLQVGDSIRIQPGEPSFTVLSLEPPQVMLLGTGKASLQVDPLIGGMTWVWVLREVDANTTRLIVRSRYRNSENLLVRVMYRGIIDPGGFIMERRTMLNIKALSEALAAVGR